MNKETEKEVGIEVKEENITKPSSTELASFIKTLQEAGFSREEMTGMINKRQEQAEETKRFASLSDALKLKKLEFDKEIELKKLDLEKPKSIFKEVEIEALLHDWLHNSFLSRLFYRSDHHLWNSSGPTKGEVAYHRIPLCDNDLPNDNSPLHILQQSDGTLRRRKK